MRDALSTLVREWCRSIQLIDVLKCILVSFTFLYFADEITTGTKIIKETETIEEKMMRTESIEGTEMKMMITEGGGTMMRGVTEGRERRRTQGDLKMMMR